MISRSYRVNQSTITLILGDITTSQADVLVSSDDYMLSMGGGVSLAIKEAAGSGYKAATRRMSPARLADIIVTAAGRLPAKYVFHAITIGPRTDEIAPEAVVRHAVRKAMRLLPQLGCRSIAFPSIGSG